MISNGPHRGPSDADVGMQQYANSMQFLPLLLLWYLCGVACVTTSKILLQGEVGSALISTNQFLCTVVPLNYVLNSHPPWRGVPLSLPFHVLVNEKYVRSTLSKCSFYYSLGFFLTNISFSVSSASFTETIKGESDLVLKDEEQKACSTYNKTCSADLFVACFAHRQPPSLSRPR